MYKSRKQIYLYHGYALAAGGYVENDASRDIIQSVASVVLPIVGGSGHAPAQSFSLPERTLFGGSRRKDGFYLRIKSARSEVVGKEQAGGYYTRSRTWLEGFDLAGKVTADLIVADLQSEHAASSEHREGRISLGESAIHGLRIQNTPVEVTRNPALDKHLTFDELRAYVRGDSNEQQNFRAMSFMEPASEKESEPYVRDMCAYNRDDLVRCTIFESISAKKLKVRGYSIDEKFGRVFLGELLVTKGMKRLNMLRFDLGCEPTGAVAAAAAAVDGETVP